MNNTTIIVTTRDHRVLRVREVKIRPTISDELVMATQANAGNKITISPASGELRLLASADYNADACV